MRKIVSILVLVSMLVILFSACAKPAPTPVPPAPTAVPVEEVEEVEEEPIEEVAPEPFTLTWYTAYATGCVNVDYCIPDCTDQESGCRGDWTIAQFHEEYPQYEHVSIEYIHQMEVGGMMPPDLDTLIAAGEAPNIIDGYGGRIGYYTPLALNFDDYLDDAQKASYIDYEGMFFGETIPMIENSGNFAYFTVNATLVERACAQEEFECGVPEPWSIVSHEQFREIGRAIKALDDGSYLGVLFGMNPSSQHLQWLWFAQVGVQAFKDGTFTGLNTPETRAVMSELIWLYNDGQFVPGAPGINDDDAVAFWAKGTVAFAPFLLGWHDIYVAPLVETGELEEAWEIVAVSGIQFDEDIQPLMAGSRFTSASIVLASTPEEQRKAAVDFAYFSLSNPWAKWLRIPLLPATYRIKDLMVGQEAIEPGFAYVEKYGLADVGVYNPHYNELRALFADLVAAMTIGVKSPMEAMFTLEQIGKGLMEE